MRLLLAIALQAAAPPTASDDIVVQGRRLDTAYKACVAGGCSVLRDAQVSIAMAEQQFRDGAYVKAKHTMAAAVARNRRHAATDPKPVAALYEAFATVAFQEGDTKFYRTAVIGQVRTLRDHLPESDPARREAPLIVGDMWIKLGQPRIAAGIYETAERQATAAADVRGALVARLRRAWLAAASRDRTKAKDLLHEAAAWPAVADPALQAMLRVAELRIAAQSADTTAIDRLIGEIGHMTTAQPVLIWAPPYLPSIDAVVKQNAMRFGDVAIATGSSSEVVPIEWADIGFWIGPDGRTREMEVLRSVGANAWTAPILRQIASRRYTSVADATGQGVYRIERMTNRGTYGVPIGSLIRRRSGPASLQVLDLTPAPGTPIAPK